MLKLTKLNKDTKISCFFCLYKNKADFAIAITASDNAGHYNYICKDCLKKLKKEFANLEIDF